MCEMSPSTAAQMHMHVWKIGALPKRLSDDVAEVWTPPGPIVVLYDVGGAGIQRSVVSVELTRLVRRPVVVRVTDWSKRAVEHALQTNVHRDSAGHIVDHLLSSTTRPLPACSNRLLLLLLSFADK